MILEELIKVFMKMTNVIKLYHWQTASYARHKASDDLDSKLRDLIDKFVEVYMGRYGRPKYNGSFNIKVEELDDTSAEEMIEKYISFLKKELPKSLKKTDTDLFNIRDEMVATLNQTLYLFTLN
jgi:hypothetical protein